MPLQRLAAHATSLRRRAGFWFIEKLFARPAPDALERLGSDYGGWYVPLSLLGPQSIVYSVGIGEDATFDETLHLRVGCAVHGFDPTPRAARYVEKRKPAGLHFHAYGIFDENRTVRFYAPKDQSHVSHSIMNLQNTDRFFDGEVRTLRAAMAEFGHARIDLLKMDIEGAEYAVLRNMLATGLRPKIVCVELEHPSPLRNVSIVLALARAGYRVCRVDGRNVTLMRTTAPRVVRQR